MTDDAETIRALKSVDAYRDQVDRIREELRAAPDEPAVYAAKALRKRAERAEARLVALADAIDGAIDRVDHRSRCSIYNDNNPVCDCGIDEMRAAIAAAKEPTDAD